MAERAEPRGGGRAGWTKLGGEGTQTSARGEARLRVAPTEGSGQEGGRAARRWEWRGRAATAWGRGAATWPAWSVRRATQQRAGRARCARVGAKGLGRLQPIRLTGPVERPQVTVNPLSILDPRHLLATSFAARRPRPCRRHKWKLRPISDFDLPEALDRDPPGAPALVARLLVADGPATRDAHVHDPAG